MARSHHLIACFVAGSALAVVGCQAGFSSRPALRVADSRGVVGPGERIEPDADATEIEYRLGFTTAGKTLLRAIEAHGGWDQWRGWIEVTYRRQRVVPRGPDAAAAPEPNAHNTDPEDTDPDNVSGSAPVAGAPVDELVVRFDPRGWKEIPTEESWLFSLPFTLVDSDHQIEYLGVEYDVRQDAEFDKLRFARMEEGASEPSAPFFVYVDVHSGLIKQVLARRAEGAWWLVQFEGWVTLDGLRLATRRRIHELAGRFRRSGPETLRWLDTLSGIRLR